MRVDKTTSINAFARLILGEGFPQYQRLAELRLNDLEAFVKAESPENYTYDLPSLEDMDEKDFLLEYLQAHQFTAMIDWADSGDKELYDLLVACLKRSPREDSAEILDAVDEFEFELEDENFARGEYVLAKFKLLGDYLVKKGMSLWFIGPRGWDCYFPVIFNQPAEQITPPPGSDEFAMDSYRDFL